MVFAEWSADLSVGVVSLDAQHQRLFQMFDDLSEAIRAGNDREAVGGIIDGLIEHARDHFVREEKLFAHANYPDAAAHKLEHDAFVRKVSGDKRGASRREGRRPRAGPGVHERVAP